MTQQGLRKIRRSLAQQVLVMEKTKQVGQLSWSTLATRIQRYIESFEHITKFPEVEFSRVVVGDIWPVGVDSVHRKRWDRFLAKTKDAKTRPKRLKVLAALATYVHEGFLGVFDA